MGKQVLGWLGSAIGLLALFVLALMARSALTSLTAVPVPEAPKIAPSDRLALSEEQGWPWGWKVGQAQWFHFANQGTRILPLDWFIHLQQPSLDPDAPPIIEGDYLQRFGFQPGEKDPHLNPYGLPIGFAIDPKFDAPWADPPWTGPVVGLTCAACHTGQITYAEGGGRLKALRVEGGSAMINLAAFQEAFGLAVGYTAKLPTRFDRFAYQVLGKEKSRDTAERAKLQAQLNALVDAGLAQKEYARVHHLEGTVGGFARTDALSLIGNRVFVALGNENLVTPDAPVNFPPLWDTAWYDWVQYNGSIRMPLVRNIGEALGVGAPVNLDECRGPLFASTVNVANIHRMEDQLGGETTLSGLRAPRWKDAAAKLGLPALDDVRVKRGATLYTAYCQRCHRPPMDALRDYLAGKVADPKQTAEFDELFEADAGGPTRRILKLKRVDLQEIGTDPNQALDFYRRVAGFQGQTLSAARGLFVITEQIRRQKLDELLKGVPDPDAEALSYNRFRAFDLGKAEDLVHTDDIRQVILANLQYRARTLDGLWATPPFLHNGSVPNLYEMLVPAERRTARFYLGSTNFDPVRVGFEAGEAPGRFLLDTALPGNKNVGHEFRNLTLDELELVPELWLPPGAPCRLPPDPLPDLDARWARVLQITPTDYRRLDDARRWAAVRDATRRALAVERIARDHPFKGVLGAEFADEERWDLVEYVKSL